MASFFEELKRRNVIKASIAYLVVGWVVLQVVSIVLPIVGAPEWVIKTCSFFLVLGFPIWVVISWVYEVTPEGLKKTSIVHQEESNSQSTNKRLNILILAGIIAAIVVSFVNRAPQSNDTHASGGRTILEHSIAVLPFDNLSSDQENEWFCDGVTEDILTHLAKLKGLKVTSRTSVLKYKEHKPSIPQIAQELGVSYILEGSVRKQGNKVLITAQLINANDEHLWAENYNKTLDDVFEIQQEVSKTIVQELKVAITPEEEKSLNSSSTENIEAYQLYLKAKAVFNQKDGLFLTNINESIALFKQAIAIDPYFADAYAEMGYGYIWAAFIDRNSENESTYLEQSEYYTNKALEIDPNNANAYTNIAVKASDFDIDFDRAKTNFEKALELNPNDAEVLYELAFFYNKQELYDIDKAIYYINKAEELNPLSRFVARQKVNILEDAEAYEEVLEYISKNDHLLDEQLILNTKGYVSSIRNKDYQYYIDTYENALLTAKDLKTNFHNILGRLYFGIYQNKDKAFEHYTAAFNMTPKSNESYFNYLNSLFLLNKFELVERILNEEQAIELISEFNRALLRSDFYFFQGNYERALLELEGIEENSMVLTYKMNIYGGMQDFEKGNVYIEKTKPNARGLVLYYALAKQKDSTLYYLEKSTLNITSRETVNNLMRYNQFDFLRPYRKDPKYIALLEKNYLPVIDN